MNLYVIERHHQLLDLWQQEKFREISVAHIDFHCDMRGLMFDRRRQVAHRIRDVREGLDEGNFLRHAIVDGIVKDVTWVHDTPGGRHYDVNTVKHTTDATAIPHLLLSSLRRREPMKRGYTVTTMQEWPGLTSGQFLDIDWDVFAAVEMDRDGLDHRVEAFLAKDWSTKPLGISVCYSPYHSHDTRDEFHSFVDRIAATYGAEVQNVPYIPRPRTLPLRRRLIPNRIYAALQTSYYRTMLALKRVGVH